jgi:hypothetical protein
MKAIDKLDDMYWDIDKFTNYVWNKDSDQEFNNEMHDFIVSVGDSIEFVSDRIDVIENNILDIKETLHNILHNTDSGVSRLEAKEILSKVNIIFNKLND